MVSHSLYSKPQMKPEGTYQLTKKADKRLKSIIVELHQQMHRAEIR